MAPKNKFKFDLKDIERTFRDLTAIGADTQALTEKALLNAAEKVQADVREAMAPQFMPAGGKYSTGETAASIVPPMVQWHGLSCQAPLGFDKSKPGAGGYLITGTPKMRPNAKLNEIFEGKGYMRKVMTAIQKELLQELVKEMVK